MGQETIAITVVGVKIAMDKFGQEMNMTCDCDSDEPFLCCPDCGEKMDMREDLCNEISSVLRDGKVYDSKLGKYELYREYYANELVNKDHFYICLYKGEKFDLEDTIKYPESLETLISEREEMKQYLISLNLLTSKEFSENFGIYTLISMNF